MRTKRLLSLVMAFFMLFTLTAPTFAWASEGDGNDGDGNPAIVNPDPVADPDPVVNPDPDPVDDQDDDQDDLGDDPAPDPDPQAPATRGNPSAGYYLVGTMAMTGENWDVKDDYKLSQNPANSSEYMITVTLPANTEVKVVYCDGNGTTTWYPEGTGNDYELPYKTYTIYFRPDYNGGDDWHYKCLYAKHNHVLTDHAATAATCTTAGNNAYWSCANCGKYFSDAAGTAVIDENSWVTSIDPNAHIWGDPTYTWADDNSTCTATRVCANNSAHTETETVDATSAVTTPATCTVMGTTTYTATFTKAAFAQQTTTEEIPMAAHNFGEDGHCTVCGATAVAQVGTTKYADITVAVTAWASTNNSTLTLLANVTLTDVAQVKSTEMHTLDLNGYTLTAAQNKNAIQVLNYGRTQASYALDIKDGQNNNAGGGISAPGKVCIYYIKNSGDNTGKDRPIIRIYGGTFNGMYCIQHSGSNGTNCPQFWIYGGTFNGTTYAIYTNRALINIYGGTFNKKNMISADSSAYTMIQGGKFVDVGNNYSSALNSDKWTYGTAKGSFNVDVTVDADGYYVVTKPIASKPGDFAASLKYNGGYTSTLDYSNVKTEGRLYYATVECAMEALSAGSNIELYVDTNVGKTLSSGTTTFYLKNNATYSGAVTLSNKNAKLVIDATNGTDAANVTTNVNGYCVVKSVSGSETTYSLEKVVATVNNVGYATLDEAVEAAVASGAQITVNQTTTYNGKTVVANSTVTVSAPVTESGTSAMQINITAEGATKPEVVYVVSDTASAIVTPTVDDSVITNDAEVADLVDVPTVLASVAGSDSESVVISLSKEAATAAEKETAGLEATDLAFEIHPVAIVTKAGSEPEVVEIPSKADATWQFALDLGVANAGKTVRLWHHSGGEKTSLGVFVVNAEGKVNGVTMNSFSVVSVEFAVASAVVNNTLTYYDNLAEAIANADAGTTVTLLADVDLSAHARDAAADYVLNNLTLDLDGHTISGFNNGVRFSGTNAVIKNGTFGFVAAEAKPSYALSVGSYTEGAAKSTGMQLQNLTVVGGVNVDNADVTLTNVTINQGAGAFYCLWVDEDNNASATFVSGTINAGANATAVFGAAKAASGTTDGTLNVTGGTINANGRTLVLASGNHINVSGGTFDTAVPEADCASGYIPTDDGNGNYGVKSGTYVAQVGNDKYESLADAVAAADSGDTITLLGNLQLDAVAMFSENKTLTLDLGGNTLSSSVDDADAGTRVLTVEAGTLTVQNGTITGRVNAYDNGTLTIAANATVNGMAVVWGDGQGASAKTPTLNVYGTISNANGQAITTNGTDKSGANINIYGGAAVTATGNIAIYQPSGNVNVFGGTITGSTAIYQKSGTLTISGGALVGNGAADTPDFANGSGADATGDALVVESCAYPNGAPTVSISAGTFTSTNGKGIASYANESKGVTELAPVHATTNTITIPADEKWVDDGNGGYTLVKKVYVAQIGDVKYETLAEAIAAVADNTATTITMIGDETIVGNAGVTIPATTIITLDLNGHTLKNAVNQDKASQVITNKGTLTIVDNSQDKSGLITNAIEEGTSAGDWWSDPQRNYATNVIVNSGTLNLQSGTIRQTAVGSICYAIDNNSTAGNAILNISGGKVVSAVGTAMRMFCNSTTNENTLNMTGGEISGAGVGFWVQLPGSNSTSKKKATVDISGGTVHGSDYAWYDYSFGDSFEVVDYSISGGVMDGDIYSYAVEGGVIDGFITGGIFSEEPDPIYVDSNRAAYETKYQSEDGWYMIGAAVAQIGTVGYISLAAAVTGASAGDTVKMLANEELDAQVVIDKSLTLDLNGKTIYNDAADDDIWGGSSWSLISVQGNGVAVTVTDTSETAGTLQAKVNDTYAMDIRDGATLTIEKGNFIGNVHAIYVCEGTLNVNGGFFKVQQVYSAAQPYDFTLNCLDANYTNDTAKITVNGGTFYMFDPQASASEPGGTADFTADDYVAIKDGDNYVVQPGWNVTFDTNGGTPTPDAQRVAAGGTVAEPAAPTMEAEIFGGWSDGMSVVTFPYTPAADVTLTAQWTAAVASITAGSPAVTTYYATLAEAIAAANADASATAAKPVVVTLLSDVNVAAPIMVSNHVTLDGGNHTITSTKNRGVRVDTNGVTVTVKNLTIQGASLERAIQVDSGKDDVTLTIDNVTANATMYTVNVCSDVDNLNLTIKDSYLTGWGVVNLWGKNGTVTITGSTLIGINDKDYNAEGWNNFGVIVVEGDTTGTTTTHAEAYAITVTNSTIEARSTTGNTQYSLLYNKPSADNAMTLEGCTVVLGNKCEFYADGGDDSTTKLKNTTVQGTDAIPELPEGYCYVEDAQGYQVVTKAVAEVWNGNTKVGSYASLADAITAATAGYTVKLLDDVALTSTQVINKSLTINLNGKNITATDARALWIKAGEVEITGSGTISATGTNLDASSSVIRVGDNATNANKAKLTIGEDVTVSSDKCYGITVFGVNDTDNDKTTSDIELVMNGTVAVTGENPAISGNGTNNLSATTMTIGSTAEVSAANDYAIYHPGKGTLTVNGKVEGKGGIEVKGGTVTINNGATVEATANAQSHTAYNNGASTSGYAIAAVSNPNYAGDPTVTINGGTINGKAIILADFEAANVGVVTATSNEIAIDPDYKWVETETAGTYKLVEKVYVAQIVCNEQTLKFESLEAAVAAAVDGDTITLLSDCEGNGIVFLQGKFGTNGLTIDFGHYTYTVSGTPVGSTGTETIGFQLLKDNKITLKDGTLTGSSRTNRDLMRMIQNYSDLTLDNMTISLVGQYYDQTTMSTCNGTTVIKDSTVNAPDFTWAHITDPATVRGAAISVGTFSTYTGVSAEVTGNSTINGDIIVDPNNDAAANNTLLLTSGTLNGNILMQNNADQATVTEQDEFNATAPEDYKWVSNDDGTSTLQPKVYVAQIEGGAKYESLAEAVAAAQADDTIIMLADVELATYVGIPAGKDITLDLAGYNVTRNGNCLLDVYGTLELIDSGRTVNEETVYGKIESNIPVWVNDGGAFTMTSGAISAVNGGIAINAEGGTTTLNGGTVTSTGVGVQSSGDAEVVVSGAAITATGDEVYGILAAGDSDVTVTSGSVTSDKWGVAVVQRATLTVDGGAITGTNDAAICTNGNLGQAATIEINAGTITSTNEIAIYLPSGDLTITGGTITGKTALYVKSGTVEITGGSLNAVGLSDELVYYGNGAYPTGDAMVVENCGYPNGAPVVEISGGSFNSDNAKGIGSYYSNTANVLASVHATGNNITVPDTEIWVENQQGGYDLVEAVVVTFDLNGGVYAGNSANLIQKIVKGTTIEPLTPVPTKGTKALTGWFAPNAEEAFDFTAAVNESVTLTAVWGGAVATVTVNGATTEYGTLAEAIADANAAGAQATVTLLENVQLSEGVDVSGNVVLDLAGYTISDASTISTDYLIAVLHGGTLTVTDSSSPSTGAISMSKQYCAIKMTKANDGGEAQAATLIVNSGTIEGKDFAISGNGNPGRGNVVITVNGGTIRNTKTTATGDDAAIYMPNTGTVTLNGGTIEGLTGVELRSGTLIIPANSTVVITGTGDPASVAGNNNGTTTVGAGIAIAQHTTDNAIHVDIAGGTVYGATALSITNPNGRTGNNVAVAVSGGTFIGSAAALTVTDERVTKFVTGGEFSHVLTDDQCGEGYEPVLETNDNDLYTVTLTNLNLSYGATLTLNDNININYIIKGVEDENVDKITVEYTFLGQSYTHQLKAADKDGNTPGRYKFKLVEVYSYQMSFPVYITVKYDGNTVHEQTYSVSTYFHNIINRYGNDAGYASFVEICYAGLDYGAAAQKYFDGRSWAGGRYDADSDNLVNADTNPSNTVNAARPDESYDKSVTGEIAGITKYSATLILGSEVSLKIYLTGDVSNVTVTCTDDLEQIWETTPIIADGNRYSFKVVGIKAFQLCRKFTFTFRDGTSESTFIYSPYTYVRNMWNNAEIGSLVKALVVYGNKAHTYWGNNGYGN